MRNKMNFKLEIRNDTEIRAYIKELISEEIKATAREDIKKTYLDEVKMKIEEKNLKQHINSSITNVLKSYPYKNKLKEQIRDIISKEVEKEWLANRVNYMARDFNNLKSELERYIERNLTKTIQDSVKKELKKVTIGLSS